MPLILSPKSRKMALREYAFSKLPGGGCPRTPLGIACLWHARVGLRPTYPPIIARFPPVKNFSYIPDTSNDHHSLATLYGVKSSSVTHYWFCVQRLWETIGNRKL